MSMLPGEVAHLAAERVRRVAVRLVAVRLRHRQIGIPPTSDCNYEAPSPFSDTVHLGQTTPKHKWHKRKYRTR